MEGVDYAWDRPSVQSLVNAGKRFAVRYGGVGSEGKQLDMNEVRALTSAGIAVVANVEGGEYGLLNGWAAGVNWARTALTDFTTLGMPTGRPIYLSVDFDAGSAHWARLDDAFKGAASVLGVERVGVYGGYRTIQHYASNGLARWYWQTYAWSGGLWHPKNHIEQYQNHVPLGGGTVDLCRSKKTDFGQWGVDDMLDLSQQVPIATNPDGSVVTVTLGGWLRTVGMRTNYTANLFPAEVRTTLAAILAAAKDAADDSVVLSEDQLVRLEAAVTRLYVPTVAEIRDAVGDEISARMAG